MQKYRLTGWGCLHSEEAGTHGIILTCYLFLQIAFSINSLKWEKCSDIEKGMNNIFNIFTEEGEARKQFECCQMWKGGGGQIECPYVSLIFWVFRRLWNIWCRIPCLIASSVQIKLQVLPQTISGRKTWSVNDLIHSHLKVLSHLRVKKVKGLTSTGIWKTIQYVTGQYTEHNYV